MLGHEQRARPWPQLRRLPNALFFNSYQLRQLRESAFSLAVNQAAHAKLLGSNCGNGLNLSRLRRPSATGPRNMTFGFGGERFTIVHRFEYGAPLASGPNWFGPYLTILCQGTVGPGSER